MFAGRKLLPRYVIASALPYVLLSLFLLTAILFTQQAGRFAEVALNADLPFSLLFEIGAALLPNVLILSLPVAVLAGIVIGFARMGSDSEIVVIRAAGVGTWALLWPALLIGLVATFATTFLHMKEAPQSARDLRRAALQGALRKLESPVEPRTFNTEIPGYVIYVRDGDKTQGTWARVFIYAQQADGSARVVTARSGRIDSSGDKSELVLSDASALKIPDKAASDQSYVVERLEQLRIAIDTGRAALLDQISKDEVTAEEMDWGELRALAATGTPRERNEAERTFHRRLALSVAPFLFALFGALIGLRIRRGGRGVGVLLSIGVVVLYYLVSLLGESIVRTNTVPAIVGQWMATAVILFLSLLVFMLGDVPKFRFWQRVKTSTEREVTATRTTQQHIVGAGRSGFPSLLDTSLFQTLAGSFLVGFISLAAIFTIFTLFELWRFIGANNVPAVNCREVFTVSIATGCGGIVSGNHADNRPDHLRAFSKTKRGDRVVGVWSKRLPADDPWLVVCRCGRGRNVAGAGTRDAARECSTGGFEITDTGRSTSSHHGHRPSMACVTGKQANLLV